MRKFKALATPRSKPKFINETFNLDAPVEFFKRFVFHVKSSSFDDSMLLNMHQLPILFSHVNLNEFKNQINSNVLLILRKNLTDDQTDDGNKMIIFFLYFMKCTLWWTKNKQQKHIFSAWSLLFRDWDYARRKNRANVFNDVVLRIVAVSVRG